MKKKNIIFATLILGVTLTASIVGRTYSRYITTDSGTGNATVAKWSAKVTGWEEVEAQKVLTLTRAAADNPYVVEGLIAPDATVEGTLNVDLTGTQVAVDLSVALGELQIVNAPQGLTTTDLMSHFDTSLKIYDETGKTLLGEIEDSNSKYLIPLNGTTLKNQKVQVKVGLKWKNIDDTDNNTWDTLLGEYGTGSAPVIKATLNLTAQQHVLSDDPATETP